MWSNLKQVCCGHWGICSHMLIGIYTHILTICTEVEFRSHSRKREKSEKKLSPFLLPSLPPSPLSTFLLLRSGAFHAHLIDRQDGFLDQSGKRCPDWPERSHGCLTGKLSRPETSVRSPGQICSQRISLANRRWMSYISNKQHLNNLKSNQQHRVEELEYGSVTHESTQP